MRVCSVTVWDVNFSEAYHETAYTILSKMERLNHIEALHSLIFRLALATRPDTSLVPFASCCLSQPLQLNMFARAFRQPRLTGEV